MNHLKRNMSILIGVIIIIIGYYNYSPSNSKTTICIDYSKTPMSQLEYGLIQDMVNTYKSGQLTSINQGSFILNDAHSVWFDLETLESFIYHIKLNTKNQGVKSKELGLRIYYGAYPDTIKWRNYPDLIKVPINYEHHHTVMMIPTIKYNNINNDFNPLQPRTYNQNLKEFYETKPNSTPTPALSGTSSVSPSRIGARNHGSLIPPGGPSGEAFY